MRKSILSSAFALATAVAQADESRDMVLAANEYSGSRRKRPAASFQEAGLPQEGATRDR
jgi:hypothetical protein